MALLMTGLCEKGVNLIWEQCDEEQFPQGVEYLKEAMRSGDPEALYFLGRCFSWGDGAVGFNDKKAYECYREGVRAGSYRCALGALRAGRYDAEMIEASCYSLEESYAEVLKAAKKGDGFSALQIAEALEWGDLKKIPRAKTEETPVGGTEEKPGEKPAEMSAEMSAEKPAEKPEEKLDEGEDGDIEEIELDTENDADISSDTNSDTNIETGTDTDTVIDPDMQNGEKQCLFWYEEAAKGGIVEGMVKAGSCYMNGRFTEADQKKGIYYADQAAARGNVWGLYQMGLYWENQNNPEAAFAYFQAASSQGDKEAPRHLGRMYLSGVGTERDIKKGISALEIAASRENTDCLAELGEVFYQDEVVERDDERAFFWYSSAYGANDKRAVLPLAHLYLSAGVHQDFQRAEELFIEAADLDESGSANLELGNLYREGIGRAADIEKALRYYEAGSEKGNAECMEILGNLYFDGDGVEENYEKAFYWLDRLSQQELLQSREKLAFLYLKGYGCEADEEKAIRLFETVAETECDGRANYELGYIYEKRNETQEDLDLAAEYYERAIRMGNESAATRFSHFRKNLFGKWKLNY